MTELKGNICTVPVIAEYRISDGKPVMISAQYADIHAEKLLRFILERSGMAEREVQQNES